MVLYVYADKNNVIKWYPLTNENADSARPSMWFSGASAPQADGDWQKQDFYLDSSTGDVYVYTGKPSADLKVVIDKDNLATLHDGEVVIGKNWFRTQGKASYVMEFGHYAEAPKNIAEAVIAERQTKE